MKCRCGHEIDYDERSAHGSVGKVMEESGFFAVMDMNGRLEYFCPECHAKAVNLAVELYELTGLKDLYINGLLRFHKKEGDEK